VQGPLTANGVTFTRADPVDGWGYISFEGAGADGSRLENCFFEYASGYPSNPLAAISVSNTSPVFNCCTVANFDTKNAFALQSSSAEISGSTISGLSGAGIWAYGGSLPLVFNNSFFGNGAGVLINANGNGIFRGNSFSGNTDFGVNYLGSGLVDARYSFWGDTSGPYDPSDDTASGGWYNPSGLGDAVSDHVNYDPWVGTPLSVDGDHIPDQWEMDHFLSTAFVDDDSDVDIDGLTDLYEFAYGTDPNDQDSEGDGMPDGYEAGQRFNPVVGDGRDDADTDRFSNLREFLSASDPRNPVSLPAIFADWNGDGDVDGEDLAGMAAEFNGPSCSGCFFDLFPDAVVNDRDAFLFSEDFGRVDVDNMI
jgi:parallel beta-helix repeat protein